jgi:hypothetical protein
VAYTIYLRYGWKAYRTDTTREDFSVDRGDDIKMDLKQREWIWAGFIWLRTETSGVLF